jgi:molecular chaperone DnaK
MDNITLGRFELLGIPPAPRGVPQIQVTFSIDTDGATHVAAKDLGTGRSQSIQVTASSGLSEEEVQQLVSEAEGHKAADQERRLLIEARNKATGLIYSTERTLEEFAEHIAEEDREKIEQALEVARAAVETEDCEAVESALAELSTVSFEMTEKLYAALGDAEES